MRSAVAPLRGENLAELHHGLRADLGDQQVRLPQCRRVQIDEPISIRTIKRFVSDYMGNGGKTKKREPKPLLNRAPVAGMNCQL